jgi:hypothetical protein
MNALHVAIVKSLQQSSRKLVQALGTSWTTVWFLLHMDLKFYPFKLLVTQRLTLNDRNFRVWFSTCYWNWRLPVWITSLWVTEFRVHVSKENCQYQSATNQCVLHEKWLHSEKFTICCGVSAQGILGPYFFTDDRIRSSDQCWVGCWNAVHILVLLDGMAAVYRGSMDSARCLNTSHSPYQLGSPEKPVLKLPCMMVWRCVFSQIMRFDTPWFIFRRVLEHRVWNQSGSLF